jgi:hypothetical protein
MISGTASATSHDHEFGLGKGALIIAGFDEPKQHPGRRPALRVVATEAYSQAVGVIPARRALGRHWKVIRGLRIGAPIRYSAGTRQGLKNFQRRLYM